MTYFLLAFKMPGHIPGRHVGLALSLITTLGDASSGVFILFEILYTAGIPFWILSAAWAGVSVIVSVALFILWSKVEGSQDLAAGGNSPTLQVSCFGTTPPPYKPKPYPYP